MPERGRSPLTLSGTAKFGSGGVGVALGGVLTFDNRATNVNSRINGHTLGFTAGGGGTVNIIGNAGAATTESFADAKTRARDKREQDGMAFGVGDYGLELRL